MPVRSVLIGRGIAMIGVTAAGATAAARVVGNCTRSQVRPSTIIVACADAGVQLTHLRWTSFGGARARERLLHL
jgi:hypothetical protein